MKVSWSLVAGGPSSTTSVVTAAFFRRNVPRRLYSTGPKKESVRDVRGYSKHCKATQMTTELAPGYVMCQILPGPAHVAARHTSRWGTWIHHLELEIVIEHMFPTRLCVVCL